jgi:sterol desaturase/sphingolipid hydroxylase (fatty acid hydroxylase superfamily)
LIAIPAFRHWHRRLGKKRDRNYAPMLPRIDRIFGTHYLARDQWPAAYGIEASLPASLGGQLLYPLRPLSPQARLPEPAPADPSQLTES